MNPSIACKLYDYETIYKNHSNAEIIVFYCNNASSHSPFGVKHYLQWLRKTHPESKQRCVMLENGINGLYRYMVESKQYSDNELLQVFKKKYRL